MHLTARDDPEAGGRRPALGDERWTVRLPLESGETLTISMGRKSRDILFGMLIADCADSGEPEPKEANTVIVGYLVSGKFNCYECVKKLELAADDPAPVQVYDVNLGIYSQRCAACRKQVVEGRVKTELFDIDDDPDEFRWTDMQKLLAEFDQALQEEDWEAASGARLRMYEKILRATHLRKLHDQAMVIEAVQRILGVQLKW